MKYKFIAALISLSLVFLALIVNEMRTSIFGVIKGYAPREFTFLMGFTFPLLLSAFFVSLFVFMLEIRSAIYSKKSLTWKDGLILLLAFPGLVVGLFLLLVVFSL